MTGYLWQQTVMGAPPDGSRVEVITESGDQRELVYKSNLWWLPDMSMYCYFVPTHWRLL